MNVDFATIMIIYYMYLTKITLLVPITAKGYKEKR